MTRTRTTATASEDEDNDGDEDLRAPSPAASARRSSKEAEGQQECRLVLKMLQQVSEEQVEEIGQRLQVGTALRPIIALLAHALQHVHICLGEPVR